MVTGHSKQRINGAIKSGKLQKDNRNKDLIRVSSVVEWLKIAPIPDTPIPPNWQTNEWSKLGLKPATNGHHSGQNTDPLFLPMMEVGNVD